MASLTLNHISKQFGNVAALSEIDLFVANGEFCVLLGPSGCGKSTLLQIVAGLTPQDNGSVLIDGQPIDHLSPRERDVAMVFQSYALYPHMTVAQNLGFGLRMHGVEKEILKSRVSETAELLGIENLLNRKPKELSGGQRQRVAMGRALVRRPKLFLLDEPLSNLDARLRVSVRVELKRLHQQIQGTILYVTHDQVEAMTLGEQVVVIREGRVHQKGPPEVIYDQPADTFVATFIGSPAMNLFEAELRSSEESIVFICEDFSIPVGLAFPHLPEGPVQVGIRPEDIAVGRGREDALKATVDMVSNVGAEKYLHARVGNGNLTVRVTKEFALHPGDRVPLVMDPSKLHVFHNGRRIPTEPR
jgi:multiple sugar transport system ATP-binding protein